jgi:FkbM family methyltransferase
MREKIEHLWLKLIRLYTFNSPIRRGKYRLYETALGLCQSPPAQIEARTVDGRRLSVDLTSGMHETVYFLGEYERAVTDILSKMILPGDICLDVGANFGWYTTLFHSLNGGAKQDEKNNGKNIGEVHSFEPLPEVFKVLKQNWTLAGKPENVFLNNLALGDDNRTVQIHRFTDLLNGFSSLSNMGKSEFVSVAVQMITLDEYLAEKQIKDVNFVKLDVEGAELMFLRGARQLFRQKTPPIMIIEMSQITCEGFGYELNDMIDFINAHAKYSYLRLDDYTGVLTEFERFPAGDIGAHVFCIPDLPSHKPIIESLLSN